MYFRSRNVRESDITFTLCLAVVDPASPRDKCCGKLVQNHGWLPESRVSIRLQAEPGLSPASGLRKVAAERLAIDKNCGEIEKKYWTEVRGDFTLEAESFA
jgi:hypothetical protein